MKTKIAALAGLVLFCSPAVFPQTNISSAPKSADSAETSEVLRRKREQALAKLLEGQRILWNLRSPRRRAPRVGNTAQLAKEALKTAIELDPNLAEAYTVLAELILNTTTESVEEAISLARTAVKISPDNYGSHLILARLYTIKSQFNSAVSDAAFTEKAIGEWKEIARLDMRNAEAFAFLSELYAKTNKTPERIDALRKWLSASPPLETRVYQTVMG
ncbi:MAG: hypothetical protein M3525_12535, partial [Acidobacteriota bacterium]|nr:hypothetical protein [Acidobacteriota bacterium]